MPRIYIDSNDLALVLAAAHGFVEPDMPATWAAYQRLTFAAVRASSKSPPAVLLLDCGADKIACIKSIRTLTGWGLREAKDFVDRASPAHPSVLFDGAAPDNVREAAKMLRASGATVRTRGV